MAGMKKGAYQDRLAKVSLFSSLSKRDLQRIASHATSHHAFAGEELTREGRPGYEFFVIGEGRAVVRRKGRKVASLKKGDFFGELALLDRVPRNATVVAETDMELWVLDGREFGAVLREVPEIAVKILAVLARRLSAADAKAIH